jgi:hypothetical protein
MRFQLREEREVQIWGWSEREEMGLCQGEESGQKGWDSVARHTRSLAHSVRT